MKNKNKMYERRRKNYDTVYHRMIQETCSRLGLESDKNSSDYNKIRFVVSNYMKGFKNVFNTMEFERIIIPEFITCSLTYNRFRWVIMRYICKIKRMNKPTADRDMINGMKSRLARMWNKRNAFLNHNSILKKNKTENIKY